MASPIYKGTLVFEFLPATTLRSSASPGRVAGFTENYWFGAPLDVTQITNLAVARAGLLATDVQIVGYRLSSFSYEKNKIQPGLTQVGYLDLAGAFPGYTNSPEDALKVLATANGIPVNWRFFIHAIPDDVIRSNQYLSQQQFQAALLTWYTNLRGGGNATQPVQWFGRDPRKTTARVNQVNGALHTITTAVSIGAAAGSDFVRLRRVYDDNGLPIKGTYLCTGVAADPVTGVVTYTLAGLPAQTRSTPSGTARVDALANSALTSATGTFITERKVGRPTLLFRGRRSKTRV